MQPLQSLTHNPGHLQWAYTRLALSTISHERGGALLIIGELLTID